MNTQFLYKLLRENASEESLLWTRLIECKIMSNSIPQPLCVRSIHPHNNGGKNRVLRNISPDTLNELMYNLNHRPNKTLDFHKPHELFWNDHLCCTKNLILSDFKLNFCAISVIYRPQDWDCFQSYKTG